MASATKVWTYDDLQQITDDRNRYEIVDGELLVTPSPGGPHQRASIHLVAALYRVLDETGVARVFHAPLDVILSQIRVVIPDLLVVKRERWDIIHERGIEGAPDLVVEILSPSSIKNDREIKRRLYATVGVPEYWIVDPVRRQIEILTRFADDLRVAATFGPGQRLRSPTLPVELDVDAMFAP